MRIHLYESEAKRADESGLASAWSAGETREYTFACLWKRLQPFDMIVPAQCRFGQRIFKI